MITEKHLKILSHLRKDARKKITEISKMIGVPVTTIYDNVRAQKKKGIVKKHVALLDFGKLGYPTSALIAIKADHSNRDELEQFLSKHQNVNSLYRINSDHDFLAEVVFENAARLYEFVETAELSYNIPHPLVFNVIKELKKEEFLPVKG